MTYTHVIFDYNGTLVDDVRVGHQASNTLFTYYGVPEITLAQFRNTFRTPWIDFYVANGVPREKIDSTKHQEVYQKEHVRLVEKEAKLKAGLEAFLQLLKSKDITLAVLSSRNRVDLQRELEDFGIATYFDAIVGEEDIYHDGTQAEKKVDQVLSQLSITHPEKVLLVGDMTQDIENARRYHFAVAAMTDGWQDGERLKDYHPDYFVGSFAELQNIFV